MSRASCPRAWKRRPFIGARAGLHADQTRRQCGYRLPELHHTPARIYPVQRKHPLCRIDPLCDLSDYALDGYLLLRIGAQHRAS